ncbi:Hypothetical protein PFR_JS9-2_2276 [Propionibacterium freudenreichii]|nr:Hypothetical protein PFR_JS12-2_2146 [Propionibacterium freudenreichii]SCC98115.1 Hypothetical protein PFR_JS12-1_2147 [Propionibacterium freudenreichii]SCQ64683.1 Hypothetical protein PFR_JS9-1_2280 [Propionibacterium freudenreichii]SCQ71306.1 Hypothetical protein PFR_JS9-2_2276 [Propionibacterium freudenreichii]
MRSQRHPVCAPGDGPACLRRPPLSSTAQLVSDGPICLRRPVWSVLPGTIHFAPAGPIRGIHPFRKCVRHTYSVHCVRGGRPRCALWTSIRDALGRVLRRDGVLRYETNTTVSVWDCPIAAPCKKWVRRTHSPARRYGGLPRWWCRFKRRDWEPDTTAPASTEAPAFQLLPSSRSAGPKSGHARWFWWFRRPQWFREPPRARKPRGPRSYDSGSRGSALGASTVSAGREPRAAGRWGLSRERAVLRLDDVEPRGSGQVHQIALQASQ